MPTKNPLLQTSSDRVVDHILSLVDGHISATNAIVTSYPGLDDEFINELSIADENLRSDIADVEVCDSLETLIQNVVAHDDYQAQDLLENVDNDQMRDYFVSKGYAVIKIDNLRDRDKLLDFIQAELYPNCREDKYYSL